MTAYEDYRKRAQPNAYPKENSIYQLALLSQKTQEGENEVEIKEHKGNE